jgi:hypothetical protein
MDDYPKCIVSRAEETNQAHLGSSILLKAGAFRIRTPFHGHIAVIGTERLLGLLTPKIGHPCLKIGVALEGFPIHRHGLATQMNAARTLRERKFF